MQIIMFISHIPTEEFMNRFIKSLSAMVIASFVVFSMVGCGGKSCKDTGSAAEAELIILN